VQQAVCAGFNSADCVGPPGYRTGRHIDIQTIATCQERATDRSCLLRIGNTKRNYLRARVKSLPDSSSRYDPAGGELDLRCEVAKQKATSIPETS
jgi:hypothetical protein